MPGLSVNTELKLPLKQVTPRANKHAGIRTAIQAGPAYDVDLFSRVGIK